MKPTKTKLKPYFLGLAMWMAFAVQGLAQPAAEADTKPTTWALKTNLLNDVYGSFNIGVETKLGKKLTLDVPLHYNPIRFSESQGLKHFFVQPEVRYWWGSTFKGHFSGVHLMGGIYNVWGQEWLGLQADNRYQGRFWGAGLSYGYQYELSRKFSVESSIGAGIVRFHYDRITCIRCGTVAEDQKKLYVGPTKMTVSLIYKIP